MQSKALQEGCKLDDNGPRRRMRYRFMLWYFGFCKLEICSDAADYCYVMVEFYETGDDSEKFPFRMTDEHRLRDTTLAEMENFLTEREIVYSTREIIPALQVKNLILSNGRKFHFCGDDLEALVLWQREDTIRSD